MAVIDSHHHIWWVANRPHAWSTPQLQRQLDRDFTPAELHGEMRQAGVDGTVLIQSLNDLQETQEYLDIAIATPWIRGVVGWVPLDNPMEVEAAIDVLRERGPLVGIRHLIKVGEEASLLQPSFFQSLALLARAGLVFETIPIDPGQFEAALKIAEKFPGLTYVMNHLGRPPVEKNGWEPWASFIKRAAALDNVAMKFSPGLALIEHWNWSTEEMRPFTDHVLESFGAGRLLAGSNWPVILPGGTYQDVWKGLVDLTSECSDSERAAILGGNAERIYGLT
jgi:L-fuconolactonase